MWALEDVLKELNDFALLLPSRPEKKKPMMLEKLAANVCAKLDQFQSFSAADALKLHECLEACNFPDDFSEQVANKSDELLACGSQAMQAGQVTSLKPQKLSSIANYLTSSEWAMLQDSDVCWWSKQRMLVERLKKLGIKSMAEITRRWVLALLYCTLPSLPEADAVYQQVQELKGCFSTCPGPSDDRPYIVNFPDDPQKLPAELLEKAYPQEQPKYVHVEKLAHVARSLTLRSSSKKLAANKQKQAAASNALATQHAPASHVASNNAFLQMPEGNPFAACMNMLAQTMMQASGMSQSSFSTAAANFQPNKKVLQLLPGGQAASENKQAASLLQIQDAQKAAEKPASMIAENLAEMAANKPAASDPEKQATPTKSAGEQPQAGSSPETSAAKAFAVENKQEKDYEQQLYEALQRRTEQKKEQAAAEKKKKPKGKGKGRGKGKKKPEAQPASAVQVLKRPAAAIAKTSLEPYQAPTPTQQELSGNKQSFVDKHYHKARKLAAQEGQSFELQCLYAREARAQAVIAWDNMQ